jgi:hypothetical protein
MKNALKISSVILFSATLIIACDPPKTKSLKTTPDSGKLATDTLTNTVDSAKSTGVDTIKKDTLKD